MSESNPHTSECRISCKDRGDYLENMALLSNTEYVQQLFRCANCKNLKKLIFSPKDISDTPESPVIIDIEKKRALISGFLITLHLRYPKIFTLEKYLLATKIIFSVTTEQRWSGEDISFTLKMIMLYLRINLCTLPERNIHTLLKSFRNYGPWNHRELEGIYQEMIHIDITQGMYQEEEKMKARKIEKIQKALLALKKKRAIA